MQSSKSTAPADRAIQTLYKSYKDNTFLLEAKLQPTCHAYQTKYTLKHILVECTDLAYIRESFYSANDMKELFQNIEIKNVMSFPKAIYIYPEKSKEFSTRLNVSYKLFLYKKFFNKIWFFPQAFPKKNLFTTRWFSTNKLSIKPDSFYKPFPYW